MSLLDWIGGFFIGAVVSLAVTEGYHFGKKGLHKWSERLAANETIGVFDAIEEMGYRLEADEERERYALCEDPPGREPPRLVRDLYRWRYRARFVRRLQGYSDVNGPPTHGIPEEPTPKGIQTE